MKDDAFKGARFVKTAVQVKDFPVIQDLKGRVLPEIAVVGRSNVGKSTLLNHLLQKPGLVKTSATPGKTQTINFFSTEKLAFADLPGYGYAKVPPEIRKQWGPMVQNYFQNRPTLQLILLLFDIRREPNEEDLQMIEWIARSDKGMILVLTKIDKVNQSEKSKNTKNILQNLHVENLYHVLYSAPKDKGRNELIAMITDALKEE